MFLTIQGSRGKIKNIIKSTPDLVMKSMITDYKTDINEKVYHCGQSNLMSSVMDIHFLCSHLYYLGEKFPSIVTPIIDLKNSFRGELVFEYNINTKHKIQIDVDYYSRIRTYVYKMIKRYSKNNDKEKIKKFVNQKLQFNETPTKLVLGYLTEIFTVIDFSNISTIVIVITKKIQRFTKVVFSFLVD